MRMLTVKNRPNGFPTIMNVFDDFFGKNFPDIAEAGHSFTPSVNVTETDAAFKLEFAVPGFDKKDFNVNIENEFITVSGKKETTSEVKEGKVTRREFSAGSFTRTFTLPENVNTAKIEAAYENGILNLVLPKKEEKKEAAKSIEVK